MKEIIEQTKENFSDQRIEKRKALAAALRKVDRKLAEHIDKSVASDETVRNHIRERSDNK